jgi:hypothetical protein
VEEPTLDAVEAAFDIIWQEHGPVSHGFEVNYRKLASRLIKELVKSGTGRQFRNIKPLLVEFPNGKIVVEPNEIATLPNGSVVLRRLNTGYKRTDEYDRLDYMLYCQAGKEHFGDNCIVEALHLTDETNETVIISSQKMDNRYENTNTMIGNIASGHFPVEVDATTCPRCPHFFVCSTIPRGSLTLL